VLALESARDQPRLRYRSPSLSGGGCGSNRGSRRRRTGSRLGPLGLGKSAPIIGAVRDGRESSLDDGLSVSTMRANPRPRTPRTSLGAAISAGLLRTMGSPSRRARRRRAPTTETRGRCRAPSPSPRVGHLRALRRKYLNLIKIDQGVSPHTPAVANHTTARIGRLGRALREGRGAHDSTEIAQVIPAATTTKSKATSRAPPRRDARSRVGSSVMSSSGTPSTSDVSSIPSGEGLSRSATG